MKASLPLLAAAVFALAGCSSPRPGRPVDPDFALYSNNAGRAFARGNYEYAARLYADALRRAREMDLSWAVANSAYNLAICRAELGMLEEAGELLGEARSEFARAGENPAAPILFQARLALRSGNLQAAAAALTEFHSRGEDSSSSAAREAVLIEGRLALSGGDSDLAGKLLASLPPEDLPGGLEMEKLFLAGDLSAAAGDYAAAAESFERAADLYRDSGFYFRMARALSRAAAMRLSAGEPGAAFDLAYRSARSLHAAGADAEALDAVKLALTAASALPAPSGSGRFFRLCTEVQDKIIKIQETATKEGK